MRDALTNLRQLTHGLFPSVLATEGLRAALDELVKLADVTTMLEVRGCHTVDAESAMAAYATVATALDQTTRSPMASTARVSVIQDEGTLNVCVELPSIGTSTDDSDFTDVADRIGALGGHFNLSSKDGRTVVTAVLPCAS